METEPCVPPHLLARQRVQLDGGAPGYSTEQSSLAPPQPTSEPNGDTNGLEEPRDTICAPRRPCIEAPRKPLYDVEAKQLWQGIALQAAPRVNGHISECAKPEQTGTVCVQLHGLLTGRSQVAEDAWVLRRAGRAAEGASKAASRGKAATDERGCTAG